jgi:hypothetical protein
MSSSHKRPCPPLAVQDSSPQKVLCSYYLAEKRVALTKHQQQVTTSQSVQMEAGVPVFTFGGAGGILIFSLA